MPPPDAPAGVRIGSTRNSDEPDHDGPRRRNPAGPAAGLLAGPGPDRPGDGGGRRRRVDPARFPGGAGLGGGADDRVLAGLSPGTAAGLAADRSRPGAG